MRERDNALSLAPLFPPSPQRADLLEASAMPPLLLQLVAHVSANRVVLARWAAGDADAASALPYPDTLHEWVATEFRTIKARQAALLGVKPPPGGGGGSGRAGGGGWCGGGGGGVDDERGDVDGEPLAVAKL